MYQYANSLAMKRHRQVDGDAGIVDTVIGPGCRIDLVLVLVLCAGAGVGVGVGSAVVIFRLVPVDHFPTGSASASTCDIAASSACVDACHIRSRS